MTPELIVAVRFIHEVIDNPGSIEMREKALETRASIMNLIQGGCR
jgi:hypothetical protein